MSSEQISQLDELQMDALREIGNVGASHASTALTKLVKTDILIDVTECRIMPMPALPNRFGDLGSLFATLKIDIDTGGSCIYMVFPGEVATYLSDLLLNKPHQPGRPMTEQDRDVLVEMGDICIRQYLVPIAKFLSIEIIPNSPTVSIDRITDRIKFPALIAPLRDTSVVRVETNFVDTNKRFQGAIIFAPGKGIQTLTFKRFGVDSESQAAMMSKFGL
ncbi:MAG: chemotaxis protein CheC [Methanomassiliicoccus sp.]|nr:chemotaxis protein CheC [Methanomassiliicoccus sp.]